MRLFLTMITILTTVVSLPFALVFEDNPYRVLVFDGIMFLVVFYFFSTKMSDKKSKIFLWVFLVLGIIFMGSISAYPSNILFLIMILPMAIGLAMRKTVKFLTST